MVHISATMFLTLDGVMEAPHLWHPAYVSDESLAVLAGQLAGATAMLLGRRTYEEFAGYWPHQPDDVPLAGATNGIRKYVLSRTLGNPGWGDTTVLGEGVRAAVRTLAEREERVLVAGSARLVRELLERGLLGELQITLDPLVAGRGRRLFADGAAPVRLELTGSRRLPHGVAHLVYRPAGMAGGHP
ncbi:dihydrofolate reductase family protein [Planobispora siamensis]|uniref:Deaminase reductase n=1 Tax=Planobispora siamensis TaxID=936338 RepID=A0A8J3SLN6_9ACTN|nr:dihydrofolate reductase family protein [Planobispora siamensis]GIH95142.1 deaminase reductase [Planobispora siamensis]